MNNPDKKEQDEQHLDKVDLQKIQEVIDEYIRPGVEEHGGSIELDSYEDGIVYVIMGGACKGCESISATLKEGVEAILKLFVPQVKSVELKNS